MYPKDVKRLNIPYLPLNVQQEIADILDDLKTSNDELAANLEREAGIREKLYKHERDRIISETIQMDETHLAPFLDVATLQRGQTYKKTNVVEERKETKGVDQPVLRANSIDLDTNSLNFDDLVYIDNRVEVSKSRYLSKDDILMCVGSGSKDHVGKVAYSYEDTKYVIGGFMAAIRVKENVYPRYLFHVLTWQKFRDYLDEELESSTIRSVSKKLISGFNVPLPPLEIQKEVADILDDLKESSDLLVDKARQAAENYRKGYSYALDRLFDFSKFN